jgi:hypothetical protein
LGRNTLNRQNVLSNRRINHNGLGADFRFYIWSFAFLLAGCSEERISPRTVFDSFQSAWRNGESHRIDDLVSESSRTYFKGIQPWIIRGDGDSMKTLQPFDRYMVLKLRMYLDFLTMDDWKDWNVSLRSDAELQAISGYLMDMLEEEFFETSLGEIDSIGGVTAGRLLRSGFPTGSSVRFSNEGGWKIDLARFFKDSFEYRMKPYLSDRFKNRDRVWEMLSEQYGERVNRSLLESRIKQ